MTAPITFVVQARHGSAAYYGYWRFSETRSVQCATSGRRTIGGPRLIRCSTSQRS